MRTKKNTFFDLPLPIPPITLSSTEERADPTTELPPILCGAIEGRKRHPKPSVLISNSTKGG